ncbi:hypothetical protein B4135_4074 [Caldibacillus debilis]|uniref:Uncharacterized protein n=1 Tax=Caldibacillus debilis TaxID=301148 RepID=A0A150L7Q8_9BACI|nr:hypothetical protein B4135_4074 [Caldibacillus debilis]
MAASFPGCLRCALAGERFFRLLRLPSVPGPAAHAVSG